MRILEESGLGLPTYYDWRSRSGCYFCFFQQRREWIGLLEKHPDLYWKAAAFEKVDPTTGNGYTWIQGESLTQLASPARVKAINDEYVHRCESEKSSGLKDATLKEVFGEDREGNSACVICHL
jgi:hypothetical protein